MHQRSDKAATLLSSPRSAIIIFVERGGVSLALAVGSVLVAGCGLLPTPAPTPTLPLEYRPDVIGVVVGKELLGDMRMRLTLNLGDQVDIDRAVDRALRNSDPDEGDLLFYGTGPEPWYYALRLDDRTESCSLNGLAQESDRELRFDFGLVLPLAAEFDPGSGNFRQPGGSFFCVNAQGQVTRLYE